MPNGMYRASSWDKSERYRRFVVATMLRRRVIGWGSFFFILFSPVVMFASLDDFLLFDAYFGVYFLFVLVGAILAKRPAGSKAGLWLEVELFSPVYTFSLMLLSGLMAALLLFWLISVKFAVQFQIIFIDYSPMLIILLTMLVAMYPLRRYRRRKYENVRVRFVRGKGDDVVAAIRSGLDSAKIDYRYSVSGSQWTTVRPSFLFGSSPRRVDVRMVNRWNVAVYKTVDPISGCVISPTIDGVIDDSLDASEKTGPR
jgi:hypothetical protein